MDLSYVLNHPAAESAQICRAQWTPDAALLGCVCDSDESLAELIDTFKTDTETRLQRIRAALETADVAGVRSEAHTIRGSARQIGAVALAEACQQLELASALTPLAHCSGLVLRMQELFREVACAMVSYQYFRG